MIYILQIPHRGGAKATAYQSHEFALFDLSDHHGVEFDTLDEAVSYGMRAGFYAESMEGLREQMGRVRLQRSAPGRAVTALEDHFEGGGS